MGFTSRPRIWPEGLLIIRSTSAPLAPPTTQWQISGALQRGDAQSVTHLGAGRYEVTFGTSSNLCSYTASIGDPANALVYNPGLVFTAGGHTSPNGVYVETKNLAGGLADYPFHLKRNCATATLTEFQSAIGKGGRAVAVAAGVEHRWW